MIQDFLSSLCKDVNASDTRWDVSNDDISFFSNCVEVFKSNGVVSLLDIGTGRGNLVKMCNQANISAHGVDPVLFEESPFLYRGNMATVIDNEHLLKAEKFSCISCVNFLHGANHRDEEIEKLFGFIKRRAEFTLITIPKVSEEVHAKCMSGLSLIHSFGRSHGGAYHHFYKIG
jgi:hypothetical protein